MAQSPSQEDDPFTTLLTLEDTLYTTAYTSGVTAGAHTGRIEGRLFGLQKGFEKYTELGLLHGRSQVWGSRLPGLSPTPRATVEVNRTEETTAAKTTLLSLQTSTRLHTNVTLLHSLTDPETFSTLNTEESVADFDDRFKRAGAKAKVVERIIGESDAPSMAASKSPVGSGRGSGPVRVAGEGRGKNNRKGDDSIEDFAGSKLLR